MLIIVKWIPSSLSCRPAWTCFKGTLQLKAEQKPIHNHLTLQTWLPYSFSLTWWMSLSLSDFQSPMHHPWPFSSLLPIAICLQRPLGIATCLWNALLYSLCPHCSPVYHQLPLENILVVLPDLTLHSSNHRGKSVLIIT